MSGRGNRTKGGRGGMARGGGRGGGGRGGNRGKGRHPISHLPKRYDSKYNLRNLILSCEKGNIGDIRKLLNVYGCSPNMFGSREPMRVSPGDPLGFYVFKKHRKVKKGQSTRIVISTDRTPLHICIRKGHEVCARLLIESGANMVEPGKNGLNATELAKSMRSNWKSWWPKDHWNRKHCGAVKKEAVDDPPTHEEEMHDEEAQTDNNILLFTDLDSLMNDESSSGDNIEDSDTFVRMRTKLKRQAATLMMMTTQPQSKSMPFPSQREVESRCIISENGAPVHETAGEKMLMASLHRNQK